MRKEKGSIAIFVLVALLFMSAFLIISFASNVNKSKTVKEQFNIISGIYTYTDGEEGAYDKAYSDLRNKNKQTMTASSENSSTLELAKTFDENMSNYRIYGNSVQNGTPTPDNPVEVQSVGDKTKNLLDKSQSSLSAIKDETELSAWGSIAFDNNWLINNLKAKTTYTISYDVECTNVPDYDSKYSNNLGFLIFSRVYGAVSAMKSQYLNEGEKTKIVLEFTTPDELLNSDANYNLLVYTNRYLKDSKAVLGTMIFSNIQIEEGTQATEYEPYGKYKIPIKLTDENGESETKNIYLDKPLRKVGDAADYIDFKTGKVVRYVGKIDSYNGETITTSWISSTGELSTGATVYYVLNTPIEETVILPQLKSFEDYTKIEVLTDVASSKIEVEYMGYTLE